MEYVAILGIKEVGSEFSGSVRHTGKADRPYTTFFERVYLRCITSDSKDLDSENTELPDRLIDCLTSREATSYKELEAERDDNMWCFKLIFSSRKMKYVVFSNHWLES